jgi:hypothetical protein
MESSARVYGGGALAAREAGAAKRLLAAVGVTAAAFGGAFAAGSLIKSSNAPSRPSATPALAPAIAIHATQVLIPALATRASIPQLRPAVTGTQLSVHPSTGTGTGTGAGTQSTYNYVPPQPHPTPSGPQTGGVQHGHDSGGSGSGSGSSGVAHGGG